jgi:hypothetical protein
MNSNPWKFDYQALDEDFLKWLMITVIPTTDREVFEELSEMTNHFTQVELGMSINGTPVDTERVLLFLGRVLSSKAEQHAEKLLADIFPTFQRLQEKITDAERDILATVRETLTDAGIRLRRFDDDDEY